VLCGGLAGGAQGEGVRGMGDMVREREVGVGKIQIVIAPTALAISATGTRDCTIAKPATM